MRRRRVAAAAACATVALLATGCGGGKPAPDASRWPLLPGARIAATPASESQIDISGHKKNDRVLIITAPRIASAQLEQRSVAFAAAHGWRVKQTVPIKRANGTRDSFSFLDSRDRKLQAGVSQTGDLVKRLDRAARRARRAGLGVIAVTMSRR